MIAASNSFNSILTTVASGLLIVVIPLGVKAVARLTRRVDTITYVLTGRPSSKLEPHPPPGLVVIVNSLVDTAETTKTAAVALVKDSKPNGGLTSRDVLDRIEEATKET